MTNAEKLTLAKHACHIRMGVIEGTHSAIIFCVSQMFSSS